MEIHSRSGIVRRQRPCSDWEAQHMVIGGRAGTIKIKILLFNRQYLILGEWDICSKVRPTSFELGNMNPRMNCLDF